MMVVENNKVVTSLFYIFRDELNPMKDINFFDLLVH